MMYDYHPSRVVRRNSLALVLNENWHIYFYTAVESGWRNGIQEVQVTVESETVYDTDAEYL